MKIQISGFHQQTRSSYKPRPVFPPGSELVEAERGSIFFQQGYRPLHLLQAAVLPNVTRLVPGGLCPHCSLFVRTVRSLRAPPSWGSQDCSMPGFPLHPVLTSVTDLDLTWTPQQHLHLVPHQHSTSSPSTASSSRCVSRDVRLPAWTRTPEVIITLPAPHRIPQPSPLSSPGIAQ